jgi:hypothetical protein
MGGMRASLPPYFFGIFSIFALSMRPKCSYRRILISQGGKPCRLLSSCSVRVFFPRHAALRGNGAPASHLMPLCSLNSIFYLHALRDQ